MTFTPESEQVPITAFSAKSAGGGIGIVMFDTVPGGAGGVLRIANAWDQVVDTALARVSACDCGEETSCYGCLRAFGNQSSALQLPDPGRVRSSWRVW